MVGCFKSCWCRGKEFGEVIRRTEEFIFIQVSLVRIENGERGGFRVTKINMSPFLGLMASLLGLILLSSGFETGTPLTTRLLSIGGGALVLGAWIDILRMALPPLR